eukprot:m.48600 g.48600  ORF g.48600 m.48600 type:complete len:266 (+) comp6041_c0_seq1:669-1466(+)
MEHGIVSQIRTLALDPNNRAAIVKDQGCLPGLVLFLDNVNADVVECAVEALALLAECPENVSTMWNELGLVVSLNAVAANLSLPYGVRTQARSVVGIISPRVTAPTPAPLTTSATSNEGLAVKSRTITLQIKGLDDLLCRKQIEEQLLDLKGVVSFVFDMKAQRVDVRTRAEITPESICSAIAKTKTMTASQVVRTEEGQEVVLSFGRGPAEKENAPRTLKYLDDDEAIPEPVISAKAVARVGDAGAGSGWFSSIGSYISKSLYW